METRVGAGFKIWLVRSDDAGMGLYRTACIGLGVLVQTALGQGLDDGLIAHWAFDEEQGAIAEDSSSMGVDAEFTGDFDWGDGIIGGALELGGTNGRATLDTMGAFNVTTFSISAWFRCENADRFRTITSRNAEWQNRQWWLTIWQNNYGGHGNGVLAFRMSPVSGTYVDLASEARVDDNEWHHAIVTVDSESGEANLYLDGELVDTITGFSSPKFPSVAPSIGVDPSGSGRYFYGAIDDLRIYNRVLNPNERSQLSDPSAQQVRVVRWREIGGQGNP